MATIRVLSDKVANQIAAGEVVERPAAVVKELVENALDAGADRIEVEFEEAGRLLIRVEDNGSGMERDDALLSLERHATSKIAETADLDRLGTFGFRGEALPSIASVSRFLLRTRPAGSELGTEILCDAGKVLHVRPCGRAPGTSVEVARLFHPVPARRKFLKSDQTESAHIAHLVRLYALAHPRVAFRLVGDGREIFRSPAASSLAERVAEIFGGQVAESLIPIEAEEEGFALRGLIGRPGVSRASRQDMVVYVNQRPVDSRSLGFALSEAYQESISKGRFPLAYLFFECDPAAVDVNVHPAKREVRFRQESRVRGFVIRAVLRTLRGLRPETAPIPERPAAAKGSGWGLGEPAGRYSGEGGVEVVEAAPRPFSATSEAAGPPLPRAQAGPSWRLLGTAHGSLIVFETASGIVLLDRKAAWERIWFERLQGQFRSGKVPSQRLLLPVPVELDPVASALLLDSREFLLGHGFEVAEFGSRFFRIESIPTWMEPDDAEPFLRDLIAALRDGRIATGNADLARDELARLAAGRAARLPAASEDPAAGSLLAELFATGSPLAGPSGRPTFIEISHRELARRFEKV